MDVGRAGKGAAVAVAGGVAAWAALAAVRSARETSFEGKVVLLTGGSRGLGLVMARRLAAEGARVSICARDGEELERARAELEAAGGDVLATQCDVARRVEVEAWVWRSRAAFGPVDVLINNASIIQVGPFDAMCVEDFELAMAVNHGGTVHATFAVLPDMRERGEGTIVNVTSIGGVVPVPHLLPYDVAKFATVGFSRGLRAELAPHGIRVVTVVPGLMRTGSPPNAHFRGRAEAEWTWFSLGSATPLTAMSAERAADRILQAARRGEAEVTLSWQAKLLRLADGVAPGLVTELLGVANRLLPDAPDGSGAGEAADAGAGEAAELPGGRDAAGVRGMHLATAASPSRLTAPMNRAARRNNEYGGRPTPSPRHAEQVGLDEEG